jgi:hypothetical protein
VAVSAVGGGAVYPKLPMSLRHPPSKGVAIAKIKMQNNFFTVEFLDGRFLLRYPPMPVCNDGTDFHKCSIPINANLVNANPA